MAHEDDIGQYLSDEATIDTVYSLIQSGDVEKAVKHIESLGAAKVVAQTFVNVQCDINNVKHDPVGSALFAQYGIKFMKDNGFKVGAAMMLHNVSAFFMPDFDENAHPDAKTTGLEAARQQVLLRREIGQPGPLMWALWDLGLAELSAGNIDAAIKTLEKGAQIGQEQEDSDGTAWCQIFIGKAKVLHKPELATEGRKEMIESAKVIQEVGEDWEKESVTQILKSVDLSLD